MSKTYTVNEIFLSPQGEGARVGSINVFVRFSFCNLRCSTENDAGFDCDTDFSSGEPYSLGELVQKIHDVAGPCRSIIFTGGEPALQLDDALCDAFDDSWFLAVETNGTKPLPANIDWVSCSPKTAEHTIVHTVVDELRYVRHHGQGIPKPKARAEHLFISPAFQADGSTRREDVAWCIELAKKNPEWKISIQQHKLWNVR